MQSKFIHVYSEMYQRALIVFHIIVSNLNYTKVQVAALK